MNARNKQILQLAVPSIISNITVPLLGLVDVAIVGHIGDASYIGAIAVGSMLFNVIYWLFGFLRMGTSGMTSQALGRRDFAEVMRLLVRSLSVGVGIGPRCKHNNIGEPSQAHSPLATSPTSHNLSRVSGR